MENAHTKKSLFTKSLMIVKKMSFGYFYSQKSDPASCSAAIQGCSVAVQGYLCPVRLAELGRDKNNHGWEMKSLDGW